MKKTKFLVVASLGLMLASSAFAAEFVKPDNDNGTVNIPASETRHNLYTAGGNVIVNGKVTGDLYAAGGMVKITGNLEDDLTVAGGNLDISGKVGGSMRIAGGNISISNSVAEDLLAAGGNVFISDSATIGADLVVAGGNVDLQAPVNGSLKIAGSTVTINSIVSGDVSITADEKLTFGPKSIVRGKITYYGNSDPVIQDGAQVGNIDRHPLPKRDFFSSGLLGAGLIITLLAWIIAGLLLMYLLKRELSIATDMIREEPWANLGIGLISLILAPIIFILLLITIIGYYIAFLLLAWYLFALALSCLVAAVFLGRWIFTYVDRNSYEIDWRVVVTGMVGFKVLTWIPLVGWLLGFLLCMAAFGAILRMARYQLRRH